MLFIGRDLDTEEDLYIDSSKSRAILICGKRGSGKSYTMGVIIEELLAEGQATILVVDPMGTFHTMCLPNLDQERLLWDWGSSPEGLRLRLLVPGDPVVRYGDAEIVSRMEARGLSFVQLAINPSDISPEAWCDLFNIGINDPMGIALTKAVIKCQRKHGLDYFIPQIIDRIELDPRASQVTKDALTNRLETATLWGFFSDDRYREVDEVLERQAINVLDLSTIDPGRYGRRPLIISVLGRDLFVKRSIARRREELGLDARTARTWLFIDEAHQFVPSGKSSLSKEILIRWVKEGRGPGLSFVVASQQPSAIDNEVLSQCDVILSHSMTTSEDKTALNRLTKDYMGGELRTYIDRIARTGQAVLVDDDVERVSMVHVRPRKSKPGGSEA